MGYVIVSVTDRTLHHQEEHSVRRPMKGWRGDDEPGFFYDIAEMPPLDIATAAGKQCAGQCCGLPSDFRWHNGGDRWSVVLGVSRN